MGLKYAVDEATGDISTVGDVTAIGNGEFEQITINAITPIEDYHAARKDYVDQRLQGLDWQESIIDFYDPTLGTPAVPTNGDRYIASATGSGWIINYIYEWSDYAGAWIETVPDLYTACFNETTAEAWTYNGAAWVLISSMINHNSLAGLQGGGAGDYYHLDATDHGDLTDANAQLAELQTDGNPTFLSVVLPERADPANIANTGIVYTKDVGGVTELFYIDDLGNIIQLTEGGILAAGQIWDIDGDTGIETEQTADDDILRFHSAGIEMANFTGQVLSVPSRGIADADGIGLIIEADDAGSGGAGVHNGGILNLYGGAKAGAGLDGYVKIGSTAGAPTNTLDDDSLFVKGILEVEAATYLRSTLGVAGNITDYEAVNDGSPEIYLGSSAAERLIIQTVYDAGAQTVNYVLFQTDAASVVADRGQFKFNVDGTETARIDDDGIEVNNSVRYTNGTVSAYSKIFTANTADAVEASLATITLTADTSVVVEAIISAINTTTGAHSLLAKVVYGARKDGAAAATEVVANQFLALSNESVATFTKCEFDVSVDDIRLRIAGVAATDLRWTTKLDWVVS